MDRNILKKIADYQLLQTGYTPENGLFNGKTGIALFFFYYARYTANPIYEDFAGEILDELGTGISDRTPVTFANGLCGIGWSIEYMKSQRFIEADTDEILEEIDEKIMERDVRKIRDDTFEEGLEGIVVYVRSRLDSIRADAKRSPFPASYLDELETACTKADIRLYDECYTLPNVWNRILHVFSLRLKEKEEGWKRGLLLIDKKYDERH